MGKLNEVIKRFKISQEKKEKAVIVFLLGVFFLLIATPVSTFSDKDKTGLGGQQKEKSDSADNTAEQDRENAEKNEYIDHLENKLEQTIGGMEGAGKVLVMITLKDDGERILDKNQPYENEIVKSKEEGKETESSHVRSQQETVLVDEDGGTAPIVVQEIYPDVEGVVVVCEGGDNADLAVRIK
ncbi:MAG: hypothetical protein NC124_04865, partial [Clostridium sp.]|nr:hypothetical protein [Clostridium sp.]